MGIRPSAPRSPSGRVAVLLLLGLAGCVSLPFGEDPEPPRVLHPQVSQVTGAARIQPRHAREPRPLTGAVLLEPDDWVETGPTGKVELLLPEAALRLYAHTRVQVRFAFEGRRPVCREVRLEAGELLVRRLGTGGFTVRTPALEVEADEPATFLAATRGGVHHALCFDGEVRARNVHIRGQTVIRLGPDHRLTLDEGATLAYLEPARLEDAWRSWERHDALGAGVAPVPPPSDPAAYGAGAPGAD